LQAGYNWRNNELVSDSIDVSTGKVNLSNSTSQDRIRDTMDLGFTWNLLDFGVSYYQAKQQADRALLLRERRRKTVHNLMQQVRQAYWQAVGAQALERQVEPLLKQVNQALADAKTAEKEKLRPPLELLNYRKSLLDLVRQLEAIRDELAQAKPRLAGMINLPMNTKFEVAVPAKLDMPEVKASVEQLEERALLQRPELYETDLQERISVLEVRKSIARMFPGIEFNVGP
ncbi:TolC family protein, partial [Massilia sp. TS11]|uniref:TolC family protein n=1 Tax=Massilia sp. TS11 TaxID=2908003 RepID=UPI001EDBD756